MKIRATIDGKEMVFEIIHKPKDEPYGFPGTHFIDRDGSIREKSGNAQGHYLPVHLRALSKNEEGS